MADNFKKAPQEAAEPVDKINLESQLGEEDSIKDKLLRMCRQNKLAAFSAGLILLVILLAIFAPVVAPYGEAEQNLVDRLQAPSMEHWFGTDELGRDVFSRILYGARLSMLVGVLPTCISMSIGITMGLISGYYRGKVDYCIMRLADIMLSFPSLLLAMVVMYTLGSSTINIFIALSLVGWASVSRVVRSQTLSLKESEYVEAAKSIGVSDFKIMFRHILPNCVPSLIVLFTLNVPSYILAESSLSYLGIGVQAPAASWGLMVNQSKSYLFTHPWLSLAPCLSIMVIVLAYNFLGDGLRDALDPYMKNH